MKSTQIRKVKRSKTRRTRRKTRTIHTGGINWRRFWRKDNAVAPVPSNTLEQVIAPVPSITLEQVKQYLLDNNYHAPVPSNTLEQVIAPVPSITLEQVKQYLLDNRYHNTLVSLNGETPNPKTKNGWYTEDRYGFGAQEGRKELLNEGLPTKDGYFNISIYDTEPDGAVYVANIDKLPDPSKKYISNKKTYILRNTRSSKLVWKRINSSDQSAQSDQSDQYDFDINNPLQITIDGKPETLKPL